MRKYQIKIDNEISSRSFTLDELLEAGLLDDYDPSIMVRATGEIKWIIARDYPFASSEQSQSTSGYQINDDGSVTRKRNTGTTSTTSSNPRGYRIDEYGQVVRTSGNSSSRLELSTDSLHFTSSSGSRTISVTTNGTWEISLSSASWVHLSKSGSNLTVRVDTNSSSTSRTDYFRLKSGDKEKRVDVYQSAGSSSSTSTSSSSEDNDGCWWLIAIGIGIAILCAIFG